MESGLRNAYFTAFAKAYSIFLNQKSRNLAEPSKNEIQINIAGISKTGLTNPENTKKEVKLRYLVLNNQRVVDAAFAADSINLISRQEMAQFLYSDQLNTEVVDIGYVEVQPYDTESPADPQYWIIGAVLGPIAFLVILFWLIAYLYYRCINPKRNFKKQASRLNNETSPHSVNIFLKNDFVNLIDKIID